MQKRKCIYWWLSAVCVLVSGGKAFLNENETVGCQNAGMHFAVRMQHRVLVSKWKIAISVESVPLRFR